MIARIFNIAGSLSFVRIINVLASFFLIMMLGSLGARIMAAAALALLSAHIIFILSISVLQGLNPLIRQYRVQRCSDLGHLIRQAGIIALACSFFSSFILWHVPYLLLLFGQDPELVLLSTAYCHYGAFSMVLALMINVFSQINLGLEHYRVLLATELIGAALRMAFAAVFILGRFSLPMMGLDGLALAELCANALLLLCIVVYVKKAKEYKSMNLIPRAGSFISYGFRAYAQKPLLIDRTLCRSILSFGLPVAMQSAGEFAAVLVSVFLVGHYGMDALAAFQVANQYLTLCMILSFGFTQALALLLRELLYQKENNQVLINELINTAMGMALLCSLFMACLFLMAPDYLLSLFIKTRQASPLFLSYGRGFFAFNALLILLDSIRAVLTGALRGFNETKSSMWIGLFSLWFIAVPVSFLCFSLNTGPVSMRLGLLSGFLVWTVLLAYRLSTVLDSRQSGCCA